MKTGRKSSQRNAVSFIKNWIFR